MHRRYRRLPTWAVCSSCVHVAAGLRGRGAAETPRACRDAVLQRGVSAARQRLGSTAAS
ncbi:hypothetical protein [Curtobacterium sp. Leaf183]|uniref:hypothetical protein n=1 Tax=Curtobacterium sp. Leaf183 TaxID=1736291 RepID=UPI001F30B840|nr:hypothetical protein [Curtobacterium sp. Leaf183]